jgi:hypothetical protein
VIWLPFGIISWLRWQTSMSVILHWLTGELIFLHSYTHWLISLSFQNLSLFLASRYACSCISECVFQTFSPSRKMNVAYTVTLYKIYNFNFFHLCNVKTIGWFWQLFGEWNVANLFPSVFLFCVSLHFLS